MSEKLTEKSCIEFAAALASKEPVPGGGGAAAMCGALGVALCSMVGNFTVGKKKYAAVESDVKHMLEKAEDLRSSLLDLVEKDAVAFFPLSQAYSIPRDDPKRDEILEKATTDACKAPLEIMHRVCEVVDLLEEMLEKGSTMFVSDVGCGALFCEAALESAAINIFVNTRTLKNRTNAEKLEHEADSCLREYGTKARKISDEVFNRLR